MKITKLIPLSKVEVDTENNTIKLKSTELEIVISKVKFDKIENKFCGIFIEDNKVRMVESSGYKYPKFINLMVSFYSALYEIRNNDKLLDKIWLKLLPFIKKCKGDKYGRFIR